MMIMIMIMTLRKSLISSTKRCRGVTSTSFVQQSVCWHERLSLSEFPTSIIIPFFLYIQHNKLPSKQANGDGSQVSKQPASTSFRWQPGDAFIHCWHRKLSDTWPHGGGCVEDRCGKHNWISLHQKRGGFSLGGCNGWMERREYEIGFLPMSAVKMLVMCFFGLIDIYIVFQRHWCVFDICFLLRYGRLRILIDSDKLYGKFVSQSGNPYLTALFIAYWYIHTYE